MLSHVGSPAFWTIDRMKWIAWQFRNLKYPWRCVAMIDCVTTRWVYEGLDSDPILCVVGRYLRLGNSSFQISTSLFVLRCSKLNDERIFRPPADHATAPHKIESSWSILQSWILLCIYTTPTRAPPLPDFLRMEASSGKKIILFYFTMNMSIIHHTPFIWTSMYLPWTFPTLIKDTIFWSYYTSSKVMRHGDVEHWTARGTCRRRFKKRFKLEIFVVVQPNGGMWCFTVCTERRIKR